MRLDESLPWQPNWRATHFARGATQLMYFASSPSPVAETRLGRITLGRVTPGGVVPTKMAGVYNEHAVWTRRPEAA